MNNQPTSTKIFFRVDSSQQTKSNMHTEIEDGRLSRENLRLEKNVNGP